MKTVEEEYPDFTKTLPASVRFDQELILVEVPVDFDISKLNGVDPTASTLTELEQDENIVLTIRQVEGQAGRHLADQLLPITHDAKQGWQLRNYLFNLGKRFKAIYKLTESYRIPKIKKKAYRKVVPHSIKKQQAE